MSVNTMRKYVIPLGTTKDGSGYPKGYPVELTIEVRRRGSCAPHLDIDGGKCTRYTELSMCGDVWQRSRKDIYAGGQCRETILELFGDDARVARLVELWDRWHLNGLKAGNRAQEDAIRAYRVANPEWRHDYSEACEILASQGLNGKYKYGSAWLVERIPPEVLREIGDLARDLGAVDAAERLESAS